MAAEESEKRFQTIMNKLFNSPKRPSSTSSSLSSSVGVQSSTKRLKLVPSSRSESRPREDSVEEDGFRRSLIPANTQVPLCRPWDRGDLMKRLATFKSMTWFGKPKAVSPVNCARRGWVNVEMDIIACEACGARLLFSTLSSWSQKQVEKAAAVFSLKLDSGHKPLCPWINNSCDESLALFPPTPAPTLAKDYKERSCALLQLLALPLVSPSAIEYMRSPQLENFLARSPYPHDLTDVAQWGSSSQSKELANESDYVSASLYHQALKLISICGWEPQMLPYMVDCEDHAEIPSQDVSGEKTRIVVYSSTNPDGVAGPKDDGLTHGGFQYDPASVILNCRLCGASAGLWAFSTIPRPLEFFRIIDSVVVNGQNDSTSNDTDGPRQKPFTWSNSIAGGPSPSKQKFRATVSLPIISRHLTADFYSIPDVKNCKTADILENTGSDSQCISSSEFGKSDLVGGTYSGSDEAVKHRNNGDECISHVSTGSTTAAQSSNKTGVREVENASTSEETCVREDPTSCRATPQDDHLASTSVTSCLESNGIVTHTHGKESENGDKGSYSQSPTGAELQNKNIRLPESLQASDRNGNFGAYKSGKDLGLIQLDKKMMFDPVRQHRYFCPWIASGDSASMPGWILTLCALDQAEKSSQTPPIKSSSISSLYKDDDPITSIRKLFMSPSEKKMRVTHESKRST